MQGSRGGRRLRGGELKRDLQLIVLALLCVAAAVYVTWFGILPAARTLTR
jgi:hypothetical protein